MERDRQRFGVVTIAATRFALDPDVGQEVHLDALLAITFAGVASPARHIKAEATRRIAAQLGVRQLGEHQANQFKDAGVSRGIGRRRVTNRLLIDADHFVDVLNPADRFVSPRNRPRAMQRPRERAVQHILDQRTLAAAAGPGDRGQCAERDLDVDIVEVVVASANDVERLAKAESRGLRAKSQIGLCCFWLSALRSLPSADDASRPRHRNRLPAAQVRPGHGSLLLDELVDSSFRHDLPAVLSGGGAEVADVVAAIDHVPVMFDDQQRVSKIAQPVQRGEQAGVVARVQADRRLVQDIKDAAQAAAELAGQTDALCLAVRERGGTAADRQIFQADIVQKRHAANDLADQLAGDLAVAFRQLPAVHDLLQLAERHAAVLVDRVPMEADGRGVVAEPAARARRTIDFVNELLELLAEGRRYLRSLIQRRIEPFELKPKQHPLLRPS